MRHLSRIRSQFLVLLLVLQAASVGPLGAGASHAATANLFAMDPMQHIIVDNRSGLALFGYDPVAFHVDQKARPGLPEHQYTHEGRIWRFTSAANKAAFEADPAAFAPMFGGHDGASIGDGILARGEPAHFVIAAGQLVLFRSLESRDRFATDEALRQKARENWPAVVRQQIGH
jgi:YHS domain-containing protein